MIRLMVPRARFRGPDPRGGRSAPNPADLLAHSLLVWPAAKECRRSPTERRRTPECGTKSGTLATSLSLI